MRLPRDAATSGGFAADHGVVYGPPMTVPARRPAQDWRLLLGAFWLTQLVETLGMSQVFALMPAYLRQMGVAEGDRLAFVGLFSSLVFVLGLPLVPLWGVWADKVSRKAVIVRSALVEAVVFALMSQVREPWQLAVTVLLIGFQLGNTGVMLAGIRDVTPRKRLGTTIAIFGLSGPVGFALGPTLAGIFIDGFGWPISSVYVVSCFLSVATALLVTFGTREIRPEVIPQGRVIPLAFGAVRGVLGDPAVRRVFAVYGVVFLANQISRPYTPILVERITGSGPGLASGIALVMGAAALIGAFAAPGAGWLGDKLGFRTVLVGALVVGGGASVLMPLMAALPALAGAALLLAAAFSTVTAMVFSLLATEVPPERRSATLNLVYLPLYVAGIIGPAMGGALAAVIGPNGPFLLGGLVFIVGAVALARRRTHAVTSTAVSESTADANAIAEAEAKAEAIEA